MVRTLWSMALLAVSAACSLQGPDCHSTPCPTGLVCDGDGVCRAGNVSSSTGGVSGAGASSGRAGSTAQAGSSGGAGRTSAGGSLGTTHTNSSGTTGATSTSSSTSGGTGGLPQGGSNGSWACRLTGFAGFAAPVSDPVAGSAALAAADFNRNRRPARPCGRGRCAQPSTLGILLNAGAGTFGAETTYAIGNDPRAMALGDFDGDGILDVAVANYNDDTLGVLLGGDGGAFNPQTLYGAAVNPVAIAVADFNGDGRLDLAVVNQHTAGSRAGWVAIYLGPGKEHFGPPSTLTVGHRAGRGCRWRLQPRWSARPRGLEPERRHGRRAPQHRRRDVRVPPATFDVTDGATALAVGDFNEDGVPDLVVVEENLEVAILLGLSTEPELFAASSTVTTALGGAALPLAARALPLDGHLADGGGEQPRRRRRACGRWPPPLSPPRCRAGGRCGALLVVVGDFNGDGRPDLAVGEASGSSRSVGVLLALDAGVGGGALGIKETDFNTGDLPDNVLLGDFNGDGKMDLAVVNQESPSVSLLLGQGAGSFGNQVTFAVGSAPEARGRSAI